jgi:hypothetical protein
MNAGRTARAVGVLALAGATFVSLAAPVAAAPRPLQATVGVGGGCIDGQAKPNTFVKVVVRDVNGVQKDREAVTVDAQGAWQSCIDFLAEPLGAGDKVSLFDFETHQALKFTIPRVTMTVNRVSDVVSGTAPAGMKLAVEAADSQGILFGDQPYDLIKHVVAAGDGTWSHDFGSDGINLIGGAQLEVRESLKGGNVLIYRDMNVPGVQIMLGSSEFIGYIAPYKHIGIKLTQGGNKVATGDAVGDQTSGFDGRFVDAQGELYRVAGGEWFGAPALGSDASWQIPVIGGTANVQSDVVTGTCFANNPYVVEAGPIAFAFGTSASNGSFSVDLTDFGGIAHGDGVLIACLSSGGDAVIQQFTAN